MISHMYRTIIIRCELDRNDVWRWKAGGHVVDPIQLDAANVPFNRKDQEDAFRSEREEAWNKTFNMEIE